MGASAIYMKTESGDSYLYCFHDIQPKAVVERIQKEMGSELGCVFERIVSTAGLRETDVRYRKLLEEILDEAITEAYEEWE